MLYCSTEGKILPPQPFPDRIMVVHYALVFQKLRHLLDARIDAAHVEYTELMRELDDVDFNDIDSRISAAKSGGFPPEPKWKSDSKTVEQVPEAKGNFTW